MNKWIAALSFLISSQSLFAQAAKKEINDKIDSLVQTFYQDSLPGAAIAITENGNMVFEKGYGVKSMRSKEKIEVTTNFNIASLTKQFTALSILQLAEQHKLSLSYKLSRFFPDMNKKVADVITIQQLLTHTSGIKDHYDYTNTKDMKHAHNKDVYAAIKNVDSLYFTPGTQFRYSNTGFCLLALIIERASGLSYNDYLETNIFSKAGMSHTVVWSETAAIANPATGYDRDSVTHQFIPSGPEEHIFFSTEGDGGIYTSLQDYLLWLRALNEGKVFSKAITQKARSIEYAIDSKRRLGYGFGWFIDESETNRKVYHSGDNGGFRTYSFTIPQEGFAIVIFSNRSDISVEEIAGKIYHLLYPARKVFLPIEVMTS